jgi:type VI secretion system secreted protein VgrG
MTGYTQTTRVTAVDSPLGPDKLLLRSMVADERLSSPFELQLDLLSEDDSIKAEDLLGQPMTVQLDLREGTGPEGDGKRYFNGFVNRFQHVGFPGRLTSYRATLVPWLWFLTRTSDCRIFQNKTVPDIVKQVFREADFTDFDERLSATYRSWEYCVQYRETDFNFVSRLLEQEGIYYFFTHGNGQHTLVLADSYSAHETVKGYEEIPFYTQEMTHRQETDWRNLECILRWHTATSVETGSYVHNDFDFEKPRADLRAVSNVSRAHARADFEIYDYPGEYRETRDGDAYARVRMEELQADYATIDGDGLAAGLGTGYLFTLVDHPNAEQNRQHLVIAARHQVQSDELNASPTLTTGPVYRCDFTAMDARTPFRAARLTPRPVVQGPQTAIVVGKQGEEIWTDKYARVKVQFHWDRYGTSDENSSRWVRVASPWAGKSWGAVFIPRIGQEVVVQFLEGDPDQPIIIGSVYNADQMPPYDLPANQTQSGVKSRSSKGGGVGNFNELRFEDKKGSEDVYFHAEKDFHRVVEHDDDLKVGNDQTIEIQQNRTETVVNGNETITIKQGNRQVELGMGNDALTLKMGNLSTTLKMGNQTTKLDLGGSTTEALQSIELKVGQSSVKLDQTGVTIKGMMIKIEGQITTDVKGTMTTVNGSAMLKAGGGITMIG